jgi:hypothetical protein
VFHLVTTRLHKKLQIPTAIVYLNMGILHCNFLFLMDNFLIHDQHF